MTMPPKPPGYYTDKLFTCDDMDKAIQKERKEWIGLTADELNVISDSMRTWNSFQITDVYFAIEAKLKEKNT